MCATIRYTGEENTRRILTTVGDGTETDEFTGGITFFGNHGDISNNSDHAFKRVGTVWSHGIPDSVIENKYYRKAGFMTAPWADISANNTPYSY